MCVCLFVCLFVSRLQCEVKLQRQQLSDSQHLLQSLRVELQVYEKIKTEVHKHNGTARFFVLFFLLKSLLTTVLCSLNSNRVTQVSVTEQQLQII